MASLTSADVAGVARAQRVLLAPLAHPTSEAWMYAVKEALKALFGAEGAVVLLTLPTGPAVSTDLDAEALAAYFAHYAHTDVAPAMLERLPAPYALEADAEHSPLYTRHVAGAAFNEWYRPRGMDRSVNLRAYGRPDGVPVLPTGFDDNLVANVLLGGSGATRGRRSASARAMLTLLQPALAAGVRTLQQAHTLPEAAAPSSYASPFVAAVLDGLALPVWLFDEAGRCLHQSPPATGLTLRLLEGDVLQAAAGQLAFALLRGWRTGAPVGSSLAVEVSGERVRLTGTYLRATERRAPAVLVRAEGMPVALPSAEAVRARFGLTAQEARVALLRAQGASTATLAERLSVSVHTVRRHTEHAMAKLGVHRVAEIGPTLLALTEGAKAPR